jgi:selenocysteine lyase/cysteine desulfurase
MDINWLRQEVIGGASYIETPYGNRLMTYGDYTASGRSLTFVEEYMMKLGQVYANTHTEDCFLGRQTTKLYHEAKDRMRQLLKADEDYIVLAVGSGTTGAILRLSQILGIYEAPATRVKYDKDSKYYNPNRPIIFVGPYEHHSNELIWKEGNAEVVEISLDDEGKFSLKDLEEKISDVQYKKRIKIGAFSAASNVTGMKSPVDKITQIVHDHDGLVFFDFAASGPYVEMEMVKENGSYFDGLYFSPHKFIGGPGSAGILVFRKELYNNDVGPTCAGGGTVEYVSSLEYDFVKDIERREDAGTPAVLQTIRSAIAMDIKKSVGYETIEKIEETYIKEALNRLTKDSRFELIGPLDREGRLSILSFNIKYKEHYLHPRFVTSLLNDLFGIQSRAGCSCAGPYGHQLLGIDEAKSERYREVIIKGCEAIKPGWVRVNFHYLLDEFTFDYILTALEFMVDYGYLFLQDYKVNIESGNWSFCKGPKIALEDFSMDNVVAASGFRPKSYDQEVAKKDYGRYIEEAHRLKEKYLARVADYVLFGEEKMGDLAWFYVHETD